MKILWKYLLQHRLTISIFLLFSGIFAGMFSLYQVEAEAVLYAFGWCAAVAAIVFCFHFPCYYKRHMELLYIRTNAELLVKRLPDPKNLLEQDYQQIIADLQDINRAYLTKWQSQRSESIDYYTTWVHQIKTPISAMRMILQCEDTEERREIQAELFKIEQYVEMVLCYFRLDSTSTDFVFKEYDLDKIVKQAVRKYAAQFVRKRIHLEYQNTDIVVLTDEKWLLFILEQLLSNAIKYTEKGKITISVDKDKILKISDTGIGIASEDLPRVFEKGFTGYNGREDKKSTGLGLYLCKQAADKLSHKLSVQSAIGAGTTFLIDLRSVDLEVE